MTYQIGDELAPSIRIYVNGQELSREITEAVVSCEVNIASDIADALTLTVVNPMSDKIGSGIEFNSYSFLDSKALIPGNTIEIYMGYGRGKEEFIGAGVIQRWLPTFPESGMPTITIQAQDGSILMMNGETSMEARLFTEMDVDEIVRQLTKLAGIQEGEITSLEGSYEDIYEDEVQKNRAKETQKKTKTKKKKGPTHSFIKKSGETDYQFCKSVANLFGFEFKIRWDQISKVWRSYFREFKSEQKKKGFFIYGINNGSLLSFSPEWALNFQPTEVKVLYFDKDTKTWETLSTGEEGTPGEDLKYKPSGSKKRPIVNEEFTSLNKVRIAAAGKFVEWTPLRPFSSAEEAQAEAYRWLKERRDQFITGNGKTIGFETLRPGDVHEISGIGKQLSGDWEFQTVKHKFDSGGYVTEFFANKIITE